MWRAGPPTAGLSPPWPAIIPVAPQASSPAEVVKVWPAPPRHRRASRPGSQIWKKLPRPTKATSVVMPVCSRMKSRHRDAPVLVELQERPVAMHEERHVVRRLQERILQRDPLLVAVEQVEPADIQRRHVELPYGVELRIAAALHHRAEMRRHGNPPLGIDPVHCTGQKPVHHSLQPLPPPRPVSSCRPRLRSAAPMPMTFPHRCRATPCRDSGRGPAACARITLDGNDRLDCAYGITWGTMGVNGNNCSQSPSNRRAGRRFAASRSLSSIKPNEALLRPAAPSGTLRRQAAHHSVAPNPDTHPKRLENHDRQPGRARRTACPSAPPQARQGRPGAPAADHGLDLQPAGRPGGLQPVWPLRQPDLGRGRGDARPSRRCALPSPFRPAWPRSRPSSSAC